eukprot:1015060-Rhodomonas_salina.1
MLLARCYQQRGGAGGSDAEVQAMELYTLDLWMTPDRAKSWVGLAKALHGLLHSGDNYGIRYAYACSACLSRGVFSLLSAVICPFP